MNVKRLVWSLCVLVSLQAPNSFGGWLPERINYQGRMVDGGGLVNGDRILTLRLENLGGSEVYAETQNVTIIDGLYAVQLGASNPAPGSLESTLLSETSVWLEIEVSGTPLTPREQITTVPYAMTAGSLPPNLAWDTTGNTGLGTNSFLGHVDAVSLELRAGNMTALKLVPDPTSNGVASVFAGSPANTSHPWNRGVVVFGGQHASAGNLAFSDFVSVLGGEGNYVFSNAAYSLIAGGAGNIISPGSTGAVVVGGSGHGVAESIVGVVGGGFANSLESSASSGILGGDLNLIRGSELASIGGGRLNVIVTNATAAAIGGGRQNSIQTNSLEAVIAGGGGNEVHAFAPSAVIAGGQTNSVEEASGYAVIGGGQQNTIESNAAASVIAGGSFNRVRYNADAAAVGGGSFNQVWQNSDFAVVAGGGANAIGSNALMAVISGGGWNLIGDDAAYALIAGGNSNIVANDAVASAVLGGTGNIIHSNALASAISGGERNIIKRDNFRSSIGGGLGNTIGEAVYSAVIGGGVGNSIDDAASAGVIAGGLNNRISTNGGTSVIGGGQDNIVDPWAQESTIPGGNGARTRLRGQWAYANYPFDQAGDAQAALYVFKNTTTDAIPTALLSGGFASTRLILATNQVATLDIQVTATTTNGGLVAGFERKAVVQNYLGNITFPSGTLTNFSKIAGDAGTAGWTVFLKDDDSDDVVDIFVSGTASTEIRWLATVRAAEVSFP